MKLHEQIPLLESILAERSEVIGDQYQPYKNHVYRVINFCFAFHECQGRDTEKIIIAGCFHDIGIWPKDRIDYLPPSIALAKTYLEQENKGDWFQEIELMIDLHHQFRRVRNCEYPLVEIFRKGDWVDASMGFRRFDLSRQFVRSVQETFPNLGFHKNLLRLAKEEFKKNPLNPLPMMKW